MIKAVAIDDEWYNLVEICDLIDGSESFQVVGRYQNPLGLLQDIPVLEPQVVFVDIELPEIDGLTLAERIHESNPEIIIVFITSFNQYALKAFDLNAVDYILKPIDRKRFQKMLDKVEKEVTLRMLSPKSKLQIVTFGQFEVRIDNIPVQWERYTAEEVFAFLLMHHNQSVHKDVIIESLWPNYEIQKARQILQTSICKIRSIFSGLNGAVIIRYGQSKYCLTLNHVQCDFFEIEDTIHLNQLGQKNSISVDRICSTCRKGFLSQQGYLWSIQKDEELRKAIMDILLKNLEKTMYHQDIKGQIQYLSGLVELMPYQEEWNYTLIQRLLDQGDDSKARRHYEWLEHVMKTEYDLTIPEKIRKNFVFLFKNG